MLELVGSRHPSKAQFASASKVVQIQDENQEQSSPAGGGVEEELGSTELKRPHKKQYVFRGGCNALAIQLFAIDDKYETR